MAHHQHHGLFPLHTPASVKTQQATTTMPLISEDEMSAEADEPPDRHLHSFQKTTPSAAPIRRQSLLTKALHTDSESHDESLGFSSTFKRQTSRSSTCSTFSAKSAFTSDDGHVSSPSSPSHPVFSNPIYGSPSPMHASKQFSQASPKQQQHHSPPQSSAETSEPTVEAGLGRKRYISFACGQAKKPTEPSTAKTLESSPPKVKTEAPKRPCMLRFACPTKVSGKDLDKDNAPKTARHLSPAPQHRRVKTPSPAPILTRQHRGSDTTIKNESPKTARKVPPVVKVTPERIDPELERTEAGAYHEFGSSDDQPEEWVQEMTCHKSRLTVEDTLKKENDIRQLGEQAEEEALEEEDDDEDDLSDDDDFDDDLSDEGFRTDDEEGFAESDDDDDDGSDYEWWAPRRSSNEIAIMAPGDAIRPPAMRKGSDSSINSIVSPKYRDTPRASTFKSKSKKTQPVQIRPPTPELPDSTDFVCGTLDEDKPLEEAYLSALEKRKAAKHHKTAQDIDPTFPTDISTDDEDDEDVVDAAPEESDTLRVPFAQSSLDEEDIRGRKGAPPAVRKPSPAPSPRRLRSPPPSHAAMKRLRSPAPNAIAVASGSKPVPKGNHALRSPPPRKLFTQSPRRHRSPVPSNRLTSPPPSRRGSPSGCITPRPFGTAFLGHRPQLTHTTSLPRSPNPFGRRHNRFMRLDVVDTAQTEDDGIDEAPKDQNDEEGEETALENNRTYSRGAIDIVQGLERKRLRRRQKYFEKYCRKEEKKRERGEHHKRPQPGKGAQRMRQVGIECAQYRGKRVLSV